jgi:hypothetical protein
MGEIISAIERMKPTYDAVLRIVPKTHTSELMKNLLTFVWKTFEELKPLSHQRRKVCLIETESWSYGTIFTELYINEWLMRKYNWCARCSPPDEGAFFDLIRRFGDEAVPHVRRPIRETFSELVDLTKRLIPYDEIEVRAEIPRVKVARYVFPWKFSGDGSIAIIKRDVNAISVRTSWPWNLTLSGDEGEMTIDITDESEVALFEDIIDHVFKLYREAEDKVAKIRAHNEEIMERMREAVGPWKIARAIKERPFGGTRWAERG